MRYPLLLSLLVIGLSARSQVIFKDSMALVALYNATGGPSWNYTQNWLSDRPVSEWYGVRVTGDRVTTIELGGNNLTGALPQAIGDFTGLVELNLNKNHLSGNLPPQIGRLESLIFAYLPENQFSGSLPAALGDLPVIESIDISSNQLSGSLPPELGNLKTLYSLNLSDNQFSGSIPASFGDMEKVSGLGLSDNQLSGSIPASLGNLQNLKVLGLNRNKLSGAIPGTLGNCSNLLLVGVEDNLLDAPLNDSLGNAKTLTSINLAGNRIPGSIPSSFGDLPVLSSLDLSNNQLTGSIPASFGNLTKLTSLTLGDNQLSGSIPTEIGNCASLSYFSAYRNNLSGEIPASLGNCIHMGGLDLSENALSGYVPATLTSLDFWSLILTLNYFTFDGLEAIETAIRAANYAPQHTIPLRQDGELLYVHAGGTLANNTYSWYKDNVLYATKVGDSTLSISGNGKYYVRVKNSIAKSLALRSDTLDLSVLPVSFVSFTATAVQHKVDLKWVTANETNAAEFVVERSSNGRDFSSIGKVQAFNIPGKEQAYNYTDNTPGNGVVYYRLRGLDKDGRPTVSGTAMVTIGNTGLLVVYPNPATTTVYISYKTTAPELTVTISNAAGATVKKEKVVVNGAGTNLPISINISKLAAGIYTVIVDDGVSKNTGRFIKN